jgi:hypothetical protein
MKKTALLVTLLVTLLIGCTTLDPNADPVVVRAEQTVSIAFNSFDTFLRWEYGRKVPAGTHDFAESLRRNAPSMLTKAMSLIKAYKTSRTTVNRDAMVAQTEKLNLTVTEAQGLMVEKGGL